MMKTYTALSVAVAVLVVAPIPTRAADGPDENTGKPVVSKVTDVTVYADRARVTRVGSVNLPAGNGAFAFAKLPGWIDEGSVRVTITPAKAAELIDVQVLKTFLARPDDEELLKAETAVQEVFDQVAALDDEKRVLDAREAQINSIRVFSLDKLPKDASSREVKIDEYAGVVKFVSESMLDVARAKREVEKKRRALQPELNARQRHLNDLRQRAQLEQRTVMIALKSSAAQNATLSLTYMIPGATWEPAHELRTETGAKAVGISSYGIVTQTTGEDWSDATISLSTQRSTQTIRIPELDKLLVGGGQPLARMIARGTDTFKIAATNYDNQFEGWNTASNPSSFRTEIAGNRSLNQARQAFILDVFSNLQEQRGTTARFTSATIQTIRTDGRPVRVPIGAVQLDAASRIVAAPEASLNAVTVVNLLNTGNQPLLPGKILLYVDGAFLGTTDTDFVAQGETFPLFMGVADQVKLSRVLDQKNSSFSWSGRRKRLQAHYVVTVENLANKPATVELTDRVPVSETEEIRVLNIRLTPTTKPDSKGLAKWDLALGPGEKKELHIEYMVDYPADLTAPTPAKTTPSNMGDESITGGLRDATRKDASQIEQLFKLEQHLKK